jgi:hypothetical protein
MLSEESARQSEISRTEPSTIAAGHGAATRMSSVWVERDKRSAGGDPIFRE